MRDAENLVNSLLGEAIDIPGYGDEGDPDEFSLAPFEKALARLKGACSELIQDIEQSRPCPYESWIPKMTSLVSQVSSLAEQLFPGNDDDEIADHQIEINRIMESLHRYIDMFNTGCKTRLSTNMIRLSLQYLEALL